MLLVLPFFVVVCAARITVLCCCVHSVLENQPTECPRSWTMSAVPGTSPLSPRRRPPWAGFVVRCRDSAAHPFDQSAFCARLCPRNIIFWVFCFPHQMSSCSNASMNDDFESCLYYFFSGGLDYGAAVGEAQPVSVLAACGLLEACRKTFFCFLLTAGERLVLTGLFGIWLVAALRSLYFIKRTYDTWQPSR